jgi:SPP1 family predicted phage head-tail adaptor
MAKAIQPGRLDQRVTIQSEVRVSDGAGGHNLTWRDDMTVWAEVVPVSGHEMVASGQIQDRAMYQIIMRNRRDIDMTAAHRLIWLNRLLNIKAMPEAGPRAAYREILAESGGPT